MEANADYRSEFINGQITAMAGASSTHSELCAAMITVIRSQVRTRHCRCSTAIYGSGPVPLACRPIRI
ncbi:MAG: hypothetical protein FJW39_11600 [Acidobacteria bacterium]|nr:hypothetical protein [Acidobacteriota bacterium]